MAAELPINEEIFDDAMRRRIAASFSMVGDTFTCSSTDAIFLLNAIENLHSELSRVRDLFHDAVNAYEAGSVTPALGLRITDELIRIRDAHGRL